MVSVVGMTLTRAEAPVFGGNALIRIGVLRTATNKQLIFIVSHSSILVRDLRYCKVGTAQSVACIYSYVK